jgi:hypothetical protein
VDRAEDVGEGLAAVVGDVEPAIGPEQIHPQRIFWIGADLAEVHRARIDRGPCLPGIAAIGAAIDAALAAGGLDHGEDDAGVGAKNVEPDASFVTLRQAVRKTRPGRAAIAAAEDAAAGPAAVEAPRLPLPLVHGGEQRLRILGIHHQVGRPGVVVDIQSLRPRAPAVDGPENTALAVRPPQVAACRDVYDVRI